MPFAKRGLLKNTDVFEPRAVAHTFARAEAFKKALKKAEENARKFAADIAGCLPVMLPWVISSYSQHEISILQEALDKEYKRIQPVEQRAPGDMPSPRIQHKSVKAKTGQNAIDPNSVTIPWLWFFTQQQSITDFIKDLCLTEPLQLALSDTQIAKIKRLTKLNMGQFAQLMKGLPRDYQQLIKEHLLINALLPDAAVDETYDQAFKNRNNSSQPWLGESAHYGNRTLAQLAEAILDHVTIKPNSNKPQINPSIERILNSIPKWSNLRNGAYDALKNALDEELQTALLKRIGTQFHFTSTDDITNSVKSLKENIRSKLKPVSLSLSSHDQVREEKTPTAKQQSSKIYPGVVLYNKPYFFLGFIPWGVTSVTVGSFTKDLLENDPTWDINVSQPTWTNLQKEKLRKLDKMLEKEMGLLTPEAKKKPFLRIKKQVEANLLAHMKNGMIQFEGREPKSIDNIDEIGDIVASLNRDIEEAIKPVEILPPINWTNDHIITTTIKNTKKVIAEAEKRIEELSKQSINDITYSKRKKQITDYYHFQLRTLKQSIATQFNCEKIREKKRQHVLNILNHLIGRFSAFYEDKLLDIETAEIESKLKFFPENSGPYAEVQGQLFAIAQNQLEVINEIGKRNEFLRKEEAALEREMSPRRKTARRKIHTVTAGKKSSSADILARTSMKMEPEFKADVAPCAILPATLPVVAEVKRPSTSAYTTPGVMSDPKHRLLDNMLESENPDIQQEAIELATKLNTFYQEHKHDVTQTVIAYRDSLRNVPLANQVTTTVETVLGLFYSYAKRKNWLSSDLSATMSTIAKKPSSEELKSFNAMTIENQVKTLEAFLLYIESKKDETSLCKMLFDFFNPPERARYSAGTH